MTVGSFPPQPGPVRRVVVRGVVALVTALSGLGAAGIAEAQEAVRLSDSITIEDIRWGFDGRSPRGLFTPLSLLIQNADAKPQSGRLRLIRVAGVSKPVDVPQELEFDIPPFEQRWFQLIPLIVDETDSWFLTWGENFEQKAEIPAPRLGDPAVVMLQNERGLPRALGAIKRFPTELFPVSVTGTDSLDAVVLDAAPELQGARLQSFLDWIHRGGRVFLLQDDQGRYPQFPTSLASLAASSDDFPVGAGRVRRLEKRASEIDPELLRGTLMARSPTIKNGQPTSQDVFDLYGGRTSWDRHRPVLSDLEAASRFYRRWWLIYPMAFLYLLAIFPGTYAIGRGQSQMRWFYMSFLGAAAVFSVAFTTLGRVGGGEQNRIRSATIACQVRDGIFDVSQWAAIGVVEGNEFNLTHDASGRLYSTGSDDERVRGVARSGAEARLIVDLPPGSSRTVVCRLRGEAPSLKAQVERLEFGDRKLDGLAIRVDHVPGRLISAYAGFEESLYSLTEADNVLVADSFRPMVTSVYATALANFDRTPISRWGTPDEDAVLDDKKLFEQLERRLVGNAFGLTNEVQRDSAILPGGILRLLLFTEDSEAFAITGDEFPDRRGCVLYVVDLPLSGR